MGLHFASFMAVYTFIEPRKRAALTTAVSSMLQQHTASIDGKLAALADAVPAVTAQAVSDTQQQQQQERAVKQQLGVTVGTAGGASSSDVQQQVLQELQKMQQQLQALSQRQQQPDDGAQSELRRFVARVLCHVLWGCDTAGSCILGRAYAFLLLLYSPNMQSSQRLGVFDPHTQFFAVALPVLLWA
jgi:hypothetical protein